MADEIYLRSCEITEMEEIYEILKNLEERISKLESFLDVWEHLTDKVAVNHFRREILVHDFTALKQVNLEKVRELGYSIEFETSPFH